jgi:hypothetical protein
MLKQVAHASLAQTSLLGPSHGEDDRQGILHIHLNYSLDTKTQVKPSLAPNVAYDSTAVQVPT